MQLHWDQGTLLLHSLSPGAARERLLPGLRWDPRVGAWRAPAHHHAELRAALQAADPPLDDRALALLPAPSPCAAPLLRPYQEAALDAWAFAGKRGLLVLPTGAGKTRTAVAALCRARLPTLILVPTRVLLAQWSVALQSAGILEIGRQGDGEHTLGPVTVATFASAAREMPRLGNRFGMLIVDEAHHFGGGRGDEPLEMCSAPIRLGLSATPPVGPAAERLQALLGAVAYRATIEELAGTFLAPFRLLTLSLPLLPAERAAWEAELGVWKPAVQRFFKTTPEASWVDFVRAASQNDDGRLVLAAWRRSRALLQLPEAKAQMVGSLIDRHTSGHSPGRVLIFAPDARSALSLSRRHLIPAITADIGKNEREWILSRFSGGQLKALLSARVLNEGVDVPAANVAIILGGSSGDRAYVQRVGRVLRPEPGKEALIYELIVEGTNELSGLNRRRQALATA